MDSIRLSQQIKFIAEVDKLKQIIRESWLVDASRKETDAEHSWHITIMALLLQEYANQTDIDILKVMKMLLIHDVVEIDAGDTFIYDKNNSQDQNERETKAAYRLFGLLPADQRAEFFALWEEFEKMETPESKFARTIDSMQPLLLAYLNGGMSWKIHNIVRSQVIATKRHMDNGSIVLWEYTLELLEDAIKKGILKD